ncbi:hypothetical protein DERF_014617 [Dermatophagoides farinae]|uniref:Uncharacterized protein n=1 Tax=Dermatophagoides farinae TaxID=6954 RepID=A0A922HMR2_DERFA|nr:hypothetical protein DERF_014617 [Dermatophagoides farinae]
MSKSSFSVARLKKSSSSSSSYISKSWPLPRSLFNYFPNYRQGPKPWIIICKHCKALMNIYHHNRRRTTTELLKRHLYIVAHQPTTIIENNCSSSSSSKSMLKNKKNKSMEKSLIKRSIDPRKLPLKKRFSPNFRYDHHQHDYHRNILHLEWRPSSSSSPSPPTAAAAATTTSVSSKSKCSILKSKLPSTASTATTTVIEVITID